MIQKNPTHKLNIKKVFGVAIAFIVFIMIIISIIKIIKTNPEEEYLSTAKYYSMYLDGKWGVIDTNKNIYVNKKKSTGKVDMVVAIINAMFLWYTEQIEGSSVYDDGEVIIL